MARLHFCNVLDVGANARRVWQFDARNEPFNLNREYTARNGEQLPPKVVAKSWGTLFQSKLNVAWLPPENVFLRVAQFPTSTPEETRAMVELQLEKLSPIPVTQALWTMHVLPAAAAPVEGQAESLQTIVVIVVARDIVEEFLGKLEGQGYQADRLELPVLDQLQATRIQGDGAWVYPEPSNNRALVAWWYGGTLRNLALLSLDSGPSRTAALKDQLVQMTWAGELDGWLTSPPRWHLVGDGSSEWFSALREALEQPVEILAPLSTQDLAQMTARRAAQSDPKNNLLPPEYAARYQQQFVDRLWGRGLLAAFAVYMIGLGIYFVALEVFSHVTSRVEAQAAAISQSYTNSIQLNAMLGVLKERETLKFAALDCYEAVAETLPSDLTLETLNFNDGKSLSLRGTAPTSQVTEVTDFYDALRRWKRPEKDSQPLFAPSDDVPQTHLNAGGATVTWSFELQLKQTEK